MSAEDDEGDQRVAADANICHDCGWREDPAQKNYRKCPECGAGIFGREEIQWFGGHGPGNSS